MRYDALAFKVSFTTPQQGQSTQFTQSIAGNPFVVYLRNIDRLDRRRALIAAKHSKIVPFNRRSSLAIGDIFAKYEGISIYVTETQKGQAKIVGCIVLKERSGHQGIDVVAKAENWDLDDHGS